MSSRNLVRGSWRAIVDTCFLERYSALLVLRYLLALQGLCLRCLNAQGWCLLRGFSENLLAGVNHTQRLGVSRAQIASLCCCWKSLLDHGLLCHGMNPRSVPSQSLDSVRREMQLPSSRHKTRPRPVSQP